MTIKRVVLFSGGLGSWAAAKRVAEWYGTDDLILLFCDTKTEDEDLYRFVDEAAKNVGGELIKLCDGRDVWDVFFEKRFLGNSMIDPCSRVLKRFPSNRFFEENYRPDNCIRYVGIDWSEVHRYKKMANNLLPWHVRAPLCEKPLLSKRQIAEWCQSEGIKPPRLYDLGFDHNNCGGFCIKAGHAHFRHLLQVLPERYAYHEQKEQEIRKFLDKDVSILKDRRNGGHRPLTLKEFRERIEDNQSCSQDDEEWGGCGCFSGED